MTRKATSWILFKLFKFGKPTELTIRPLIVCLPVQPDPLEGDIFLGVDVLRLVHYSVRSFTDLLDPLKISNVVHVSNLINPHWRQLLFYGDNGHNPVNRAILRRPAGDVDPAVFQSEKRTTARKKTNGFRAIFNVKREFDCSGTRNFRTRSNGGLLKKEIEMCDLRHLGVSSENWIWFK